MAEIFSKLQEFLVKCSRVWAVMKKPNKEELKITAQASGLGILLIGLMGFLIAIIVRFLLIK